jgi:hypothetical protein
MATVLHADLEGVDKGRPIHQEEKSATQCRLLLKDNIILAVVGKSLSHM